MNKLSDNGSKNPSADNVIPFKNSAVSKPRSEADVVFRSPFLPVRTSDIEPPLILASSRDVATRVELQTQALSSVDEFKAKWRLQIGAAKIVWGKLTETELVKIGGHRRKLIALIEERYATTHADAERQVASFFDRHKS